MREEILCCIVDFPGYVVSSEGRVISKRGSALIPDAAGRNRRYLAVRLHREGKRLHALLHKLIFLCFQCDVPDGYQVHHIDHNPHNNRLDNLRLVTHMENQRLKKENVVDVCVEDYAWEELGVNI